MSCLSPLFLSLAALSAAQQVRQGGALRIEEGPEPLPSGGSGEPASIWYAGDTHEHPQSCEGYARPLDGILRRMVAEDLRVAFLLVWNPGEEGDAFSRFVCSVTGEPDPLSTPERILQFGVETSGLDCARWGHVIGMGIGPDQARIARGSLQLGDCADMDGLGLGCPGGDGSGVLNARAAERFFEAPGAVSGYAHSIWSLGLYRANGYDWQTNLAANGYATDTRCLDPEQTLAIPSLAKLIEEDPSWSSLLHGDLHRAMFPLLGAVDAVLGEAQFFETRTLTAVFPLPFSPPANWHGLYYKLASAGLRVGLSGGSDSTCPLPGVTEFPRTYVWLQEPFSLDAWTRGVVAGHTTLGVPGLRIGLRVNGRREGEEVVLPAGQLSATVAVEVESTAALADCVELIVDGEVSASQPVVLASAGTAQLTFGAVFKESAWVAARLCSQRAHTAAIYVISDARPIADCAVAEYWMVWCDIVTQLVLASPELALFECQEGEALERIARARRAFKSYRDLEGFDPAWMVERFGRSTPGCRGPIGIGTTGRARGGASLLLTCVNAPPLADGLVVLSRAPDPNGTCDGEIRAFVDTQPGSLIGTFPARSTRSGYAEVLIPSLPGGEPVLYAQFVWTNPPDCASVACAGGAATRSASDALSLLVEAPVLASIEVTPTNPTIALGTSAAFTAMGIFSDGTTQDLTSALAWNSSSPSVATLSNAPGSQGLATAVSVGLTGITAVDLVSGLSGTTGLRVTPAVLSSIEVTPTNPSIALGLSASFTAMGTSATAPSRC